MFKLINNLQEMDYDIQLYLVTLHHNGLKADLLLMQLCNFSR